MRRSRNWRGTNAARAEPATDQVVGMKGVIGIAISSALFLLIGLWILTHAGTIGLFAGFALIIWGITGLATAARFYVNERS